MTTLIYLNADDGRWHIDVMHPDLPHPVAVFLCDTEEEAIAYQDEAMRITRQRIAGLAHA